MATDVGRQDLLLKVISRFDFYIDTTNSKAALIAAFNTFVVSAVVLKWGEITALFDGHPNAAKAAAILLSIVALASVFSLGAVFLMVRPFLRSPKAPNKYHSHFFFDHVAEHPSGNDYLEAIAAASDDTIDMDLALQAHALAQGVRSKFRLMNIAVLMLVIGELVPFALILLMILWTAVFG